MLGLFLQAIAFIFVGAGVIVATGFGLAYLIAKSNEHDQSRCECVDCQHRRNRAIAKQQHRRERKKPAPQAPESRGNDYHPSKDPDYVKPDPGDFWATSELATGRHVIVKGATYRVTGLRTMPDGNTKVGLQNVLTQVHTMIMITRDIHEIKLWRKGMERDIW